MIGWRWDASPVAQVSPKSGHAFGIATSDTKADNFRESVMPKTPVRANIRRAKDWFAVLQTTRRSQTAVMTLGPGQATGEEPESHRNSEQILLVIEGELAAEIGGKRSRVKAGDVVIIPARVKHKFTNRGDQPALTFNVYTPPEYPPDEKG